MHLKTFKYALDMLLFFKIICKNILLPKIYAFICIIFYQKGRGIIILAFFGGIPFQSFISFTTNQLKWSKAYNTFQRKEHGLDLWVRGEPTQPLQLFVRHKRLMTHEGVIKILGPIHKEILQTRRDYFLSIQERSLLASRQRWMASTNSVWNREQFGYRNF